MIEKVQTWIDTKGYVEIKANAAKAIFQGIKAKIAVQRLCKVAIGSQSRRTCVGMRGVEDVRML